VIDSGSVSTSADITSVASFSSFSRLAANDRGYGHGRVAGVFAVAMATKEMRAQRLLKAH
jgi:hypothetical protein